MAGGMSRSQVAALILASTDRFWGEPPCFCMVKRGGIVIMLSQMAKTGPVRPNHEIDPQDGAWDARIRFGELNVSAAALVPAGWAGVRGASSWPCGIAVARSGAR